MKTLIIQKHDLLKLIDKIGINVLMDEIIVRLEQAFSDNFLNSCTMPARFGFKYVEPNPGVLELMPFMKNTDKVVVKTVSYNPQNPNLYNIPTIIGNTGLYDVTTGHLLALTDSTFLTAVRTGAASAVASKIMADSNSSVLGLIGAGAQAVTQAHAICRILPIKKIYVYDIDKQVESTIHQRLSFLNIPIQACNKMEVEQNSDIICTATSVEIGKGPVISGDYLKDNVHINAIGSDLPGKIEIPLKVLQEAIVVPDFKGQAIVEGECQQLKDNEIGPELNDLLTGKATITNLKSRITVFDSTGCSLEDYIIMDYIYCYAKEYYIGEQIELANYSEDVYNPYSFK